MPIERREQERFSLNLQARISYRHINDQPPVIITEAANISAGGAFVRTAQKFALSSKIKIDFYLSLNDLKKAEIHPLHGEPETVYRSKHLGQC